MNATTSTEQAREMIRAGLDDIDRAITLANQLNALLAHAYGEGGESFRCLADELQDNYLWLASDLASALQQALHAACVSGAE